MDVAVALTIACWSGTLRLVEVNPTKVMFDVNSRIGTEAAVGV